MEHRVGWYATHDAISYHSKDLVADSWCICCPYHLSLPLHFANWRQGVGVSQLLLEWRLFLAQPNLSVMERNILQINGKIAVKAAKNMNKPK